MRPAVVSVPALVGAFNVHNSAVGVAGFISRKVIS
jgi:hypothetical protein